jgi:hypothetical protein
MKLLREHPEIVFVAVWILILAYLFCEIAPACQVCDYVMCGG